MKRVAVITLSERTLVYRPTGPLDITGVVDFSDLLLSNPNSGAEIVLDLSAVTVVDASGLPVLVRCLRRICSSYRGVRILDPSPHVARMLALTGIDRVLPVEAGGATRGDCVA